MPCVAYQKLQQPELLWTEINCMSQTMNAVTQAVHHKVFRFRALLGASRIEEARMHLHAFSMDFGSLFDPLSCFPNATPARRSLFR